MHQHVGCADDIGEIGKCSSRFESLEYAIHTMCHIGSAPAANLSVDHSGSGGPSGRSNAKLPQARRGVSSVLCSSKPERSSTGKLRDDAMALATPA